MSPEGLLDSPAQRHSPFVAQVRTLLAGEQANLIKRRLAKFVKANWPQKRRNFRETAAGKSAVRGLV
jgi:hypothetical protein